MISEETLRVITRHALEAIVYVMRVAVKYGKGQKELKIIVLHLKSTLARPTFRDAAYPEKLWTASPRN